jgi:hypothetical protein
MREVHSTKAFRENATGKFPSGEQTQSRLQNLSSETEIVYVLRHPDLSQFFSGPTFTHTISLLQMSLRWL